MSLIKDNTITLVVVNDDGNAAETLIRAKRITGEQAPGPARETLEINDADTIANDIKDPNSLIPNGVTAYRVISLTTQQVVAYAIAKGDDTSYVDLNLALAQAGKQSLND